jgi:hypothetical protein
MHHDASKRSNSHPFFPHERVPTFLGSVDNVFEIDQFYKYYSETQDEDDAYDDSSEQ